MTEFTTEVVAAPERFALWQEVAAQSHMPNRHRSNDHDDFRARMRIMDLGSLQVSALAYPHLEIARTAKVIRQADPEAYQINYFLAGGAAISHGGRDTVLCAGDFVVVDSSRAFHADVQALPDGWSGLVVQCPRGVLPLPEKAMRNLLGVPIDGRRGMGGVLARWLTDLNARAGEFTPADVPTLAQVTRDLLASVFAVCVDAEDAIPPEIHRHALKRRIDAFIEQHLGEPALTPDTIATAHGISARHLYTLFEEEGRTVAAWIRERRLEHCRRDLADPSLRSRSIHAIATRWGFINKAHFSRAFRARYDMTPSDYRHALPHAMAVQK
ncbi:MULTISPECIES: helix-turn-helix domain-containing protein [unclassified Streptosporangium]|uniref:AraC-like ligand-binding domain-containing protein n=1 Tax=unclassified Streptosporangium TaxID=2632669 RepID=UPI002E2B8CB9|nr:MULTISPECIES: helix-turn-helix domain-containing protein [unclassified Streptosporangium]